MLLKQSEAVAGIIELNRMDGKCISEAVRTHTMNFPRLRVYQGRQTCSITAVSYNPPGMMPVNAKNEFLSASGDRATAVDVVLQHPQRIPVKGQGPESSMLLFLHYCFIQPLSACGTEAMSSAQPSSAIGAEQPGPALQVNNSH